MIVVSDTSVLTNLAAIGQLDLLRKLYSSVHVANGVRLEDQHIHQPRDLVATIRAMKFPWGHC